MNEHASAFYFWTFDELTQIASFDDLPHGACWVLRTDRGRVLALGVGRFDDVRAEADRFSMRTAAMSSATRGQCFEIIEDAHYQAAAEAGYNLWTNRADAPGTDRI